jgi:hypothetical protein
MNVERRLSTIISALLRYTLVQALPETRALRMSGIIKNFFLKNRKKISNPLVLSEIPLGILYRRMSISFLVLLFLANNICLLAQVDQKKQQEILDKTPPPQQALQDRTAALDDAHKTAKVLFNPIKSGTKPPQPNPYATTSLNEAAAQTTFSALGVDKDLMGYIKNFYFFLEWVVRCEYGARLIALAKKNSIDFLTEVQKSWSSFVTSMTSKYGSWQKLEDALLQQEPDRLGFRGTVTAPSWQEAVKSDFWKSMSLTTQSLSRSEAWQRYVKFEIVNTFNQDQDSLGRIELVEQTLFKYLPNLEVAYYDQDFTSLRNSSEMLHLRAVLNDWYRRRLVAVLPDWGAFKTAAGTVDMQKVYAASGDFMKTSYYLLVTSANDPNAVYASAAENQLPSAVQKQADDLVQKAKEDPSVLGILDQLVMLAMIKNLHALMQYLYDRDHLEKTMDVLANKSIQKPEPSLFTHTPDEYLLLDDQVHLYDSFKQVAQAQTFPAAGTAGTTARLQFSFGDLLDGAKNVATEGWKTVSGGLEQAGESIADTAKELGFGTAAVFIAGFDTLKVKDLFEKSKGIVDRVKQDLNGGIKDLGNVVTDAMNVAKDGIATAEKAAKEATSWVATNIVGKGCETILSNPFKPGSGPSDKELCDAVGKSFETVVDMGINAVMQQARLVVEGVGGVIRLAADAAGAIAQVVVDVVTGNFKDIGPTLLSGIKTMASDAAITILETLSFTLQFFMEQLIDSFKLVSYFISILTRVFIDITVAVSKAFVSTVNAVFRTSWSTNQLEAALNSHERTIGTAITTGLLLATIPLTGGASTPMVVMGLVTIVGPQLFAVYGSYQEDEAAKAQQDEQTKFVDAYSTYVNNNKIISQQEQNAYGQELQAKYKAELDNQQRGLGFTSNSMMTDFESIKEQTAVLLGKYWDGLLTPDANGLRSADVGALYGVRTDVYDLNPSQGFALYNMARESFGQEIAAAPALVTTGQGDASAKVITQNWFNQKEMMILQNPVTQVHIRFQAIYVLTAFNIGLYCGKEIDIKEVLDSKKAPLDAQHLAVMIVFTQERDKAPQLKVYEHEGKGWLATLQGPAFQRGTWYHIKAFVSDQQVMCKIWAEPEQEPGGWQTVSVSGKQTWQTIGVVASGAAVEYQFIEPKATIATTQLRPNDKYCAMPCDLSNPKYVDLSTEKDRELEARGRFDFLMAPKISEAVQLQAIDQVTIVKGNYIYQAPGTADNAYVIMGELTTDFEGQSSIAQGSLGATPGGSSNCYVSLISQKAYKKDGLAAQLYCPNVTAQYIAQRGSVSDSLAQKINDTRATYLKSMTEVTFGTFKLQAASAQDLGENRFVYTMPLLGLDGTVLKDEKGQPYQDFVIFALLNKDNYIQGGKDVPGPGISFIDMNANKTLGHGVASLVSGNVYGADSTKPVRTGYGDLLDNYTARYGALTQPVKQRIDDMRKVYEQKVKQLQTTQQAPAGGKGVQPTTGTDVSTKEPVTGPSTNKLPPRPTAADQSLQQRTDSASANEDISF